MENKKQAKDSVPRLFFHPENQYNFELLYKYLFEAQSNEGFLLCKIMPSERNHILSFFRHDSTAKRIYFIDMVNPLIDTLGLQETIASIHEKIGNKKDIFFIYNIEDCIERLKTGERDFFERLNLIRDFFMRYSSVFVFFMTEWLVKEMIRYAFDFYDWLKLTFAFVPEEEERRLFQIEPGIEQKYSNPHEKIKYWEKKIAKINEPQRRFLILNELGSLYYQIGNYNLGLQYTINAIDIFETLTDKRIDDLVNLYNNLSIIYQALGQLEKALEFQLKALDMLEREPGKNHPYLATSYNNISLIYRELGQLPKALEFQLKALDIREKMFDKNHPDMASNYNNLSTIYLALGQLEKALEFQLKALGIREQALDKNHPSLANSYHNLAVVYQNMGQLEKALEFQLKALDIREKVLGKNHPEVASSYINLSAIYQAMGHTDKALFFAEKAVAILTHLFPNGHPNLIKAKQNLEIIKKNTASDLK